MKIKFTGTGDGRGIPVIGCQCRLCTIARKEDGRNRRRRVSVIISDESDKILFDTPPTIGEVLNEEKVFQLSAVFLSHKHYDHVGGITEFEYWPERIPVYGNISVLGNFEITDKLYENCEFNILHEKKSVRVKSIRITPFSVSHKVPTFGLMFKEDEKRIVHFNDKGDTLNDYEKKLVKESDVVVFHTVAFDGGTDHLDVVRVMNIAETHPSTRIVITHIGHNNLAHEELVEKLAACENMIVAYDGLEIEV
ncbi:MAG: MBL fold metallo-hydrolase [Candidatus Neomarinimicrobiota bacterium]